MTSRVTRVGLCPPPSTRFGTSLLTSRMSHDLVDILLSSSYLILLYLLSSFLLTSCMPRGLVDILLLSATVRSNCHLSFECGVSILFSSLAIIV